MVGKSLDVKARFKDLAEHPRQDLLPRILFMTVNADTKANHEAHQGHECNCKICTLITIFKQAVQQQSLEPLRQKFEKLFSVLVDEIYEKSTKNNIDHPLLGPFLRIQCTVSELVHRYHNFGEDEEEILTFIAALEMLNIEVPEVLKEIFNKKNEQIFKENKMPIDYGLIRDEDDHLKRRNKFSSHTLNKKLMDICDLLTLQDIFNMKTAFSKDQQEEYENISTIFSLFNYSDNIEQIKGFKETLFFCIIMIMFKESTLDRTHSHKLMFMLEEALKKADIGRNKSNSYNIKRSMTILERYPIASNPPGLCIVFSMLEGRAAGAKEDHVLVQKCFRDEFKFDTIIKTDPSKTDVTHIAHELKASKYMFYDSLVVFFMAHGDEDTLTVKDGKIHRREDLIKPFTEIEWLKNKPKLFFIQACAVKKEPVYEEQGMEWRQSSKEVQVDNLQVGMKSSAEFANKFSQFLDTTIVNPLADHLVSYATMWYEEASRDAEDGSMYIKSLVDSLQRLGREKSIEDVLKNVHYNVNMVRLRKEGEKDLWKQTPYYESSLQKDFVFPHPGN